MAKGYPLSHGSQLIQRLYKNNPGLESFIRDYKGEFSVSNSELGDIAGDFELKLGNRLGFRAAADAFMESGDLGSLDALKRSWYLYDDVIYATDLVMLGKWNQCKQVFKIDKNVEESLMNGTNIDSLPSDVLLNLPYPIIYVDAPHTEFHDGRINKTFGYFIWLDETPEGIILNNLSVNDVSTYNSTEKLLYCRDFNNKYIRTNDQLIITPGSSIKESILSGYINNVNQADIAPETMPGGEYFEERLGITVDGWMPILKNLVYIISENNDPTVIYKPKQQAKDTVSSKRNQETVTLLGQNLGRNLGEVVRYIEDPSIEVTGPSKTDRRNAPHVVMGHMHSFWHGKQHIDETTGKRVGERLEVQWVAPYFTRGDSVAEHETIHEQKTELEKSSFANIELLSANYEEISEDSSQDLDTVESHETIKNRD